MSLDRLDDPLFQFRVCDPLPGIAADAHASGYGRPREDPEAASTSACDVEVGGTAAVSFDLASRGTNDRVLPAEAEQLFDLLWLKRHDAVVRQHPWFARYLDPLRSPLLSLLPSPLLFSKGTPGTHLRVLHTPAAQCAAKPRLDSARPVCLCPCSSSVSAGELARLGRVRPVGRLLQVGALPFAAWPLGSDGVRYAAYNYLHHLPLGVEAVRRFVDLAGVVRPDLLGQLVGCGASPMTCSARSAPVLNRP